MKSETSNIKQMEEGCKYDLKDIDCNNREEWGVIFGEKEDCENATDFTDV